MISLATDDYYGPYAAYVDGTQILVLQATPETVRIVVGLNPTLIQWENHFRVVCIVVPIIYQNLRGKIGAVLTK